MRDRLSSIRQWEFRAYEVTVAWCFVHRLGTERYRRIERKTRKLLLGVALTTSGVYRFESSCKWQFLPMRSANNFTFASYRTTTFFIRKIGFFKIAIMETERIQTLLEQLDDEVDDLQESLGPLLQNALSKTAAKLPLLDKAKLYVLVTYAIESILFCEPVPTTRCYPRSLKVPSFSTPQRGQCT